MARKACLIAMILVLGLAVPALAQKKAAGDKTPTPLSGSPASTASHASQSFSNFGQTWTGMSEKERNYFIEGMVASFRIICLNAVVASGQGAPGSQQDADKKFRECMGAWFPYRPSEVRDSMTALYQEKANNVVPFDTMFGMALLKIKGDPYEENLAKLRQDLAKRAK